LGVNYGGLYQSDSSISIMSKIIDEIFAVMHAAGYETFWNNAEEYKKAFFENIVPPTFEHNSSTLQDIKRKVPTEIDSLNGAIIRIGRQYHVDTPYNELMTKLVRSIEGLYDYQKS
jgi:2-dehydropantoate 2-reductase